MTTPSVARTCSVIGIVLLGVVVSATAQGKGGKGKKGTETAVSVLFDDAPGDKIRSDGGEYLHDADGVRAVLLSNGNLSLDTRGGTRAICFDFDTEPDPCDYVQPAYVIVAAVDPDNPDSDGALHDLDAGLQAITTNGLARLVANFDDPDSADDLRLRMGANPLNEDFKYLGTSYLSVSCEVVTGTVCSEWRIETADGDTARLFRFTPRHKKDKAQIVTVGDFTMPTGFTVTLEN